MCFDQYVSPEEKGKINKTFFKQICHILTSLTYLDDLHISSSAQDLVDYQQIINPSVTKPTVPEHGEWNNLSVEDFEAHIEELKSCVASHQTELIKGILRIFSFCGFPLKSIDSSNEAHKQLHVAHNLGFPSTLPSGPKTKVSVSEVLREQGGKIGPTKETQNQPFVTQLGKSLYRDVSGHPLLDKEMNKAVCTNFVNVKGYQTTGEIHSLAEFDNFLNINKGKFNRRLCLSLLGNFWDPHFKHLLIPVVLGKLCLHHLYRESEGPLEVQKSAIGYDEPAGKETI